MPQPPKGWPPHIAFLDFPVLSTRLTQQQRDFLVDGTVSCGFTTKYRADVAKSRKIRIGAIADSSHPACGQSGLFAAEHLEPDAFIVPYMGLIHGQEDMDESSDYDLSIDREFELGIDAAKMGNAARFVNDYRGIPSRRDKGPNAEFRECWVVGPQRQQCRTTGVFVLPAGKTSKRAKGIVKGEEIVVSYGKGFWQGRTAAGD